MHLTGSASQPPETRGNRSPVDLVMTPYRRVASLLTPTGASHRIMWMFACLSVGRERHLGGGLRVRLRLWRAVVISTRSAGAGNRADGAVTSTVVEPERRIELLTCSLRGLQERMSADVHEQRAQVTALPDVGEPQRTRWDARWFSNRSDAPWPHQVGDPAPAAAK